MSLYSTLAWPLLRHIEAETAHGLTLMALKTGLLPDLRRAPDDRLRCKLAGMQMDNPVGLAAGFDKHGEVPDAMLRMGFGFAEIGCVTPLPQPGNPRPRVFRLEEDRAVINRFGFNSEGLEAVAARLASRNYKARGPVGANLGANKESQDRAGDFSIGYAKLAPLLDFLVVNVSSPNTPGLRNLQGRAELAGLLERMAPHRQACPRPLFVKIAPDLTDEDLQDIAALALDHKLDGIIATNTTILRPESLRSANKAEAGGLSGAPLREQSTDVLRKLYPLVRGKLHLVGVGGIASGADAYAKIRAGAAAVQVYSALIYEGPGLVGRINAELSELLRRDGFATVADAVGADFR
ncbi:quinone-dependent dihydroorotate dehydrogenase [Ferrovibrio sp.]|uniref:quinone-dependent dihydroorotate dehydrogenase n=1 Tax=Ferrovibrio sp. TaxID=1917215 RepID=UPI0035AE2DE5